MTTTPKTSGRFGVRVGDDGRWHARYATLGEARDHAARLSTEGALGVAQIVDSADGYREQWRDGSRAR